jgi:hypothetical protein
MNKNFEPNTLHSYDDAALVEEICRVAKLLGDSFTRTQFDKVSRAHSSTLSRRFGSWQNALLAAGVKSTQSLTKRNLSRDEIVAHAREWSEGITPELLTRKEFLRATRIPESSIYHQFGSWRELLRAAGISPNVHGKRYTDAECFENVLSLWTHYGRQPFFSELNKSPSNVGSKAYIFRWGGWRNALKAFIEYANSPEEPFPVGGGNLGGVTILEGVQESRSKVRPETTSPRSISLTLRYKVLSRDHFRCVACGRSPAKDPSVELHVDHITPWSRGGPTELWNLRALCSSCNLGKGARLDSHVE